MKRASSQAGRLQKRGAGGALREFPGLGATQGATQQLAPKSSDKPTFLRYVKYVKWDHPILSNMLNGAR